MHDPLVVHHERTVDRRPPLLWMTAAGFALLICVLMLMFTAYTAYQAREQSRRNGELFARLDRADVKTSQALSEQQRLADAAVQRLIRDNRAAAEQRQAVLVDLLNQQLRLIASEVRDPQNQEGRAAPTLTPSPTPGPTFTPRPSPAPSRTHPNASSSPRPRPPSCAVALPPLLCIPSR